MSTTTPPDVTQALTRALHVTDTARRAGWAKAFGAESKLDDALRDLGVARSDVVSLARSLAFITGFTRAYLTNRIGGQSGLSILARVSHEWESALPEKALAAGRDAGRRAAELDAEAHEGMTRRAEAKNEAKRSSRALDRAFRRGSDHGRDRLARQCGFPNVAAMLNHFSASEDTSD